MLIKWPDTCSNTVFTALWQEMSGNSTASPASWKTLTDYLSNIAQKGKHLFLYHFAFKCDRALNSKKDQLQFLHQSVHLSIYRPESSNHCWRFPGWPVEWSGSHQVLPLPRLVDHPLLQWSRGLDRVQGTDQSQQRSGEFDFSVHECICFCFNHSWHNVAALIGGSAVHLFQSYLGDADPLLWVTSKS